MSVIASKIAVAGESFVTLYTAETDGTINIRILNAAEKDSTVELYVTATPSAPATADTIEHGTKLTSGGVLLEMGEPIRKGESVVVRAAGETINLACRVSGWAE